MLEVYARIGRVLYRIRALLLFGVAAGTVLFGVGLLGSAERLAETRVVLPVLLTLWCLCMFVFANAFGGELPGAAPSASRWQRLIAWSRRLLYYLLAVLVTALGIGVLLLTARAALVVMNELGG